MRAVDGTGARRGDATMALPVSSVAKGSGQRLLRRKHEALAGCELRFDMHTRVQLQIAAVYQSSSIHDRLPWPSATSGSMYAKRNAAAAGRPTGATYRSAGRWR
jgi:hypothetical protein